MNHFFGFALQIPLSIVLVGMGFLLRAKSERRGLLIVAVILQIRYLLWRGLFTLDLATTAGIAATGTLFLAEVYGITQNFLSYRQFSNSRKYRLPQAPAGYYPTADIFVPVVNEPIRILEGTLTGCLGQDYPGKFRVHVLDDGPREEVRRLAEELSCNYISRTGRKGAKAGNLNNALAKTDGELVAIFDMDHVPTRDFLKSTAGFFNDKRIGFVQTPQYFYNPDVVQKNLRLERDIRNEQDFFFRVIQPGRDHNGSSLFSGSSAVFRRQALESVDGFRTETVTEDLHTSLLIHSKGWRSIYLDRVLSAGLAPESASAFLKQRARWAKGAAQTFFKTNPLLVRGLSMPQRLDYLSSVFYFFLGIPRIIYLISPLFFLLFGISPIKATPAALLQFFFSYYLVSILVLDMEGGKYRKPLWPDVYETLVCFSMAGSVLTAFLPWGRKKFHITPKGQPQKGRKGLSAAYPQLALLLILAGAISKAAYHLPPDRYAFAISAGWCIFNSMLLFFAVMSSIELTERRSAFRIKQRLDCTLRSAEKQMSATITGLNEYGAEAVLPGGSYFGETALAIQIENGQDQVSLKGEIVRQEPMEGRTHIGIKLPFIDKEQRRHLLLQMFGAHPPEADPLPESSSGGIVLIARAFFRLLRKDRTISRLYPRFPLELECNFHAGQRTGKARQAVSVNISRLGLLIMADDGKKPPLNEDIFVSLEGVLLKARQVAVKDSKNKTGGLLHLKVVSVLSGLKQWQIMTIPYSPKELAGLKPEVHLGTAMP